MTDIDLQGVSLIIHSKSAFWKPSIDVPVLRNVTTKIKQGHLTALMGASGSGKTTLLNLLAGKLGKISYTLTGTVVSTPCPMAYVPQGDFLIPHFTVREYLTFYARLTLRAPLTEIHDRVEDIMATLGLLMCAETRIGDENTIGISGGERRRVTIASCLLTSPALLFLDEPTTGLDANAAHGTIAALKVLTERGIAVVVALHQPAQRTFALFDDVILLAQGALTYAGPLAGMDKYFTALGFPCPRAINPADHYIDVCSVDGRSARALEGGSRRVRWLQECWAHADGKSTPTAPATDTAINGTMLGTISDVSAGVGTLAPASVGVLLQLWLLWHRFVVSMIRDWRSLLGSMGQVFTISLFISLLFVSLGDGLVDMKARTSLLYISATLTTYVTLVFQLHILTEQLPVFDHDRAQRLYSGAVFLLARLLCYGPLLSTMAVGTAAMTAAVTGLRGGEHFALYCAISALPPLFALALASFATSVHRSFAVNSLLANTVFTFSCLGCGFFITTATLPSWVRWVPHVSYLRYAFSALVVNEFKDRIFDCPLAADNCYFYSGARVLSELGVGRSLGHYVACLAGCVGVVYALALIVLHFYVPAPLLHTGRVESSAEDGTGSVYKVTAADFAPTSLKAKARLAWEATRDVAPSAAYAAVDIPAEADSGAAGVVDVVARGADIHVRCLSVSLRGTTSVLPYATETLALFTAHAPTDTSLQALGLCAAAHEVVTAEPTSCMCSFTALEPASRTRTLCHGVSFHARAGSLTWVLGGSGCGKTTLISCLSGRVSSEGGYQLGGSVHVDGVETLGRVHPHIGVVQQQDDQLLPALTVRETLTFAVQLRLPHLATADVAARVRSLLWALGLTHCADSMIGDRAAKGISGGERRRVSIGVQLASVPRVLLLDEPTSGLDSFTAYTVCVLLRQLAHAGTTVIASMHQPREHIFTLADNVMLMARGCLLYAGPRAGLVCSLGRLPWAVSAALQSRATVVNTGAAEVVAGSAEWCSDVCAFDPSLAQAARVLTLAHAQHVRHGRDHQYAPPEATQEDSKVRANTAAPESAMECVCGVCGIIFSLNTIAVPCIDADQHFFVNVMVDVDEAATMSEGLAVEPRAVCVNAVASPTSVCASTTTLRPADPDNSLQAEGSDARVGCWRAFGVLWRRSSRNLRRQPHLYFARVSQIFAFGVLLVLFFWRQDRDQQGMWNRIGYVTISMSFVSVGMLNALALFPPDRELFYAEREQRLYPAPAFLSVYVLAELSSEVLGALLFALVSAFVIDLSAAESAGDWWTYAYVCFSLVFFGESLGLLFASITRHVGVAVSLVSTFITFADTMGGLLAPNSGIWAPLRYLNYAFPHRYAVRISTILEFRGAVFTCSPSQLVDGVCPYTRGEQILEIYGFDASNLHVYMGILAVITVAYRMLAVLVLVLRRPSAVAGKS